MEKMEWDELSAAADAGMQGQGKIVEAMRRLQISLDNSSRSMSRFNKVLFVFNTFLLSLRRCKRSKRRTR